MDRHEMSPPMVHGPGTIMVVCSAGDAWATGPWREVHEDMTRHLGTVMGHTEAPEPVRHEATDPEWDEEAQEYVLACTCGTWETRGDKGGITVAFDAHLDAEGVPANELAQLEADQREARMDTLRAVRALAGGRTWPRVSALMEAAERLALTIPANSPGAGEVTVTPGPELAAVAEALGVDSAGHPSGELAARCVAIIRHRERVKAATELSRAVGQFPEILATAAPELRSALRTMLADAADALAEPEPTKLERPAAPGVYGSGVLGVFLDQTRHPHGAPHQAGGRCWCRVAHGQAEAIELNRRAGF